MKNIVLVLAVIGFLFIVGSSFSPSAVSTPTIPTLPVPASTDTETPDGSTTQLPIIVPVDNANLGDEGSFTVENISSGSSYVTEDTSSRIISLRVHAKGSQIYVGRIQVDLGATKNVWLGLFKSVAVIDDWGTVLARTDLTKNNVTSSGGRYFVTLAGFNYAVQKNSSGALYVRADSYPSIDDSYNGTYTVSIPRDGVRAQDGRGANIYGPVEPVSATVVRVSEI